MSLKSLKPVVMQKGLEKEVYNKIVDFFNDYLFSFIEEVLNDNKVYNSKGIVSALLMGRLKYERGLFYSKGKISNNLAKELEKLGAKWSKTSKGYRITDKKLPADVLQAIARVNIHNQEKISKIKSYLDGLSDTSDYIKRNMTFDIEISGIMKNLDVQLKRSLEPLGTIPLEMTDFQVKEITNNYTTNLGYYINKWSGSEIIKLREKLQPYILGGYRAESLEDMIQKEKNISKKKAKFLARQETELLVAEYRKNRFKEMGVTRYRWSSVMDERTRPLHRQLNGKIFSWDNPPIIDEHTGERGNPAEAYNCRCVAIPVVDSSMFM